MKVRDSGMPEESFWESLFDVPSILACFQIERFHDVAEIGCGYGTFTIPAAKRIQGTVYAFDIDRAMVDRTARRAEGCNVVCEVRDVMTDGFGVQTDAVLLFNILHGERPEILLRHAFNAIPREGEVLAIHWRRGKTPRGPSQDIRPTFNQIVGWGRIAGLELVGNALELPPWHFGVRLKKSDHVGGLQHEGRGCLPSRTR